jgi:hypothetical protein
MAERDSQPAKKNPTSQPAKIKCQICETLSEEERGQLEESRRQAALWQCPRGHRVCEIHAPEHSLRGDVLWLKCQVCGGEWEVALGAAP